MGFRCAGFSPALSLLMPTSSFLYAPAELTSHLHRCIECSPTNLFRFHSFGSVFDARLLSTHGRSTSELLRTLYASSRLTKDKHATKKYDYYNAAQTRKLRLIG